MKFKRALAAFSAAIVAVTSIAVTPLVAGAAGVERVPDGTEEVLATFTSESGNYTQEFTGAWENGESISVTLGNLEELAQDENVFIKMTASDIGTIATGEKGEYQTPFEEVIGWGWSNYSGWVSIGKLYNNWSTEFEVGFAPTPDSTAETAYSYVPLSEFNVSGTTLAGNFQAGAPSKLTLESLEIVRINTVEFETTILNPSKNEEGNEVYLNIGTDLNLTKLSENAKLRYTFTTTADGSSVTAGWGCGAIGYASESAPDWWESTNQIATISSPGPETQGTIEVKCSAIPADATQLVAQIYSGNGVFDKVELLDVKSEEPEPTTYSVTVAETANGSVTADKTAEVAEGETVTLTVNPAENFELNTLKAATATADVTVSPASAANKYTFVMPAADVTVTAAFKAKMIKPAPEAAAGNGEVTLTWKAVPNATKYQVVYTDGEQEKPATDDCTETTYTVTGLSNGTKYGFLVRAFINDTWTEYTESDYIYATPVAPAPTKPAITGYKVGDYQVKLEWTALEGAEMYRVYTYSDGVYTRQFTCDSNRNVATVTGLEGGKEYGFVVSAKVDGAWTDYSDKADLLYATPTGTPKPGIVGYKVGNYKVKLEWKAVEGAEMYRVYTYADGVYTRKFTCSGNRNIATVTGLISGTEYAFVVSAKVDGAWTDYSNTNDLVYATPTGDPAPVITGYKCGDGKVKLTWYALEGAEMYRVYSLKDGVYTRQCTTYTSTTATVSGLENGTEYGFVVSAKVNGVWTNYKVPELLLFATPNA